MTPSGSKPKTGMTKTERIEALEREVEALRGLVVVLQSRVAELTQPNPFPLPSITWIGSHVYGRPK